MRTIAVVGTGFIGSVHARNAARHPAARLVAVYDANIESAKRIAAETGSQPVADVAEIFDNRQIEAVVIATPTNTHVEYLKRSAQASKAIYS
jgi:myo-inositol 2-dehydrogenase / D-chiro-inositol 1-dehydrogenase